MSSVTIVLWGGLDPGGQAGIAADLQACTHLGAAPRIVLTARTAQTNDGFQAAWPVAAQEVALVAAGLELPTARVAVKTGMLATVANLQQCERFCRDRGLRPVVDPLHRSSSGGWLWPGEDETAVRAALMHNLLPLAACVTPNWLELEWLVAQPLPDLASAERALATLPCPAVLKGGHAPAEEWRGVDIVWDGAQTTFIQPDGLWTGNVRGTGCRFATALAIGLADGKTLPESARSAKALVADLAAATSLARV